jgi:hypothetical protein
MEERRQLDKKIKAKQNLGISLIPLLASIYLPFDPTNQIEMTTPS